MTKTLTTRSADSRRTETDVDNAVKFRKAYKTFVTKNDARIVLRNLNMTVPKGAIYGLVGSSASGKTTLLNCIIGRRKLDSGELWVLRDGKKITKPRIGFMPQSLALHQELTIWESMRHYGWLIGMRTESVVAKVQFLVELLGLPDINEKINALDRGHQRLVSFALVLLLEPELIILDEPTVGLDPVFKDTMWTYLKELTGECDATVIFATHYSDEVKNADIVGFMRKGRLMVEDSPGAITSRFHETTLESTFAKLSQMQDALVTTASNDRTVFRNLILETDYLARIKVSDYLSEKSASHWKALIWKNFVWIFRNWWLVFTLVGVPIGQCLLFFVCFGHVPRDLNVAYFNNERHREFCDEIYCNSTNLGCHYLRYLNESFIKLVRHESETSAVEAVFKGECYASVVIKSNYTAELKERVNNWQEATDANVFGSTLDVYRDTINAPVSEWLKMVMQDSFTRLIAEYLHACKIKCSEAVHPFKWKTSLQDLVTMEHGDFSSPGVLLTTIFLLPAGLGALTMLTDKDEGTFDRCISLGVRPLEMLISHVITDVTFAFGICFTLFAFTTYLFAIEDSYVLLALLVALTCFCGLWFGYVLASVCRSVSGVFYITSGAFLSLTLLCGVVWPLQGMVPAFKLFAYVLPLTLPSETLRNILRNGRNYSRLVMWRGFATISAWTGIFIIICVLITRRVK